MTVIRLPTAGRSSSSPVAGVLDAVSEAAWRRASQVAVIGLFVIGLTWSSYVAQHVLVPILLAWAIATVVLPLVEWLQDQGVPRVIASIAVTLLLLSLIVALLFLLSAPLVYWLGRASYIGALLKEKLDSFTQPMALLQELQKGLNAIGSGGGSTIKVAEPSSGIVTIIMSVLTPAISQFVLFIGALAFYLVYRDNLRRAVVLFVNGRDTRLAILRALNDIDDNMTTYFGTFTLVNLGLGAVAAVITWSTGLPNPLLWGVLACVLNYIPYIGPAVVVGTLTLVGLLVHPTLGQATAAPLLFLVVVTAEGQFITPALMGKRLELNPFGVFLSIALFAWLWGPIGAFLAVPMLMTLSVVLGQALSEEKPELPC
jgi:predicted PurR-regulated permease PerM